MIIIYTFFTELLGVLIKYNNNFQFFSDGRYAWHNVIIYNVYQIVFFIFFFEVFRKVTKKPSIKKQIRYLSILCVVVYITNAIILNPLHNQMTHAHIIGSIMMVYIVVMYFLEKVSEEPAPPLKFNLLFWISSGLIIFYTLFSIISTIYLLDFDIGIQIYFRPLLLTSIALMYGLMIVGLLVGKRKAFR
ncbi:hypothetical protein [Flagellimonas okinawensis]|uniref:DUF998 domain-containing protein n=1 Tax=Flagellimonas okinawensis TaxID=3031324 RepID=A0ABT5XKY5_9FLAO|nr:hypothetical protein [[Muricauda] okinawensis]MDF0706551.1 hypothetical protein [[Muricauda] okinawensis]